MGAWGFDNLENDTALDWLGDFCRDPNEAKISDAIAVVTEIGEDYLDADYCCEALAAAEIIAAINGSPNPSLPKDAQETVSRLTWELSKSMIENALQAITMIKTDSELKELCEEGGSNLEWWQMLEGLEKRLKTSSIA